MPDGDGNFKGISVPRIPWHEHEHEPVHLPAVLAETFGISRSEARRVIAQGGVKIDGETEFELDVSDVTGKTIQLGRRRTARIFEDGSVAHRPPLGAPLVPGSMDEVCSGCPDPAACSGVGCYLEGFACG